MNLTPNPATVGMMFDDIRQTLIQMITPERAFMIHIFNRALWAVQSHSRVEILADHMHVCRCVVIRPDHDAIASARAKHFSHSSRAIP